MTDYERPIVMAMRSVPKIVTPAEYDRIVTERRIYEKAHPPCTPFLKVFRRHVWTIESAIGSAWMDRRCTVCGKQEHRSISHTP